MGLLLMLATIGSLGLAFVSSQTRISKGKRFGIDES